MTDIAHDTRYPALVAAQHSDVIVVGSVSTIGIESAFSQQGPLVSVWAPGEGVECASNNSAGSWYRSGTSMAAGMVSGLAAYYLSLYPVLQRPGSGLTSRFVQSRLKSTSWSRGPTAGFKKAVWNGLSSPVCPVPPKSVRRRRGRRDDVGGGYCPISFSSSSSTISSSTSSSTMSSETATTLTSSQIVIASSTDVPLPQPSLSLFCVDKKWFNNPKACSWECVGGTCFPIETKFRRRCMDCVAPIYVSYECICPHVDIRGS